MRISLLTLSHLCSHLQNASRARLGLTSIPESQAGLAVCTHLLRQGFITALQRGSTLGPDTAWTPTTQLNVATRRLWLTLKFSDSQPVLRALQMVSRPSKAVRLSHAQLTALTKGRWTEYVPPLQPGECLFVGARDEIYEVREAVERGLGGRLLCRAR